MKRFFPSLQNVPNKYIKEGVVNFFLAFFIVFVILMQNPESYENWFDAFFIILLGISLGYTQYRLSIARGREKYLKERLAKHDTGFDKNWGDVSKSKRMAVDLVFITIGMGVLFALYLLTHPWFAGIRASTL